MSTTDAAYELEQAEAKLDAAATHLSRAARSLEPIYRGATEETQLDVQFSERRVRAILAQVSAGRHRNAATAWGALAGPTPTQDAR